MGEDVGSIYQMNIELPLESHEYCLIASAEGLTLLNEKKVNKQENDEFASCSER